MKKPRSNSIKADWVQAKRFPNGTHEFIGKMVGGIWQPYEKYKVPGSFEFIQRGENWTRYVYTEHYAQMVKLHDEELYQKLHRIARPKLSMLKRGILPGSKDAGKVLAEHVAERFLRNRKE